jgi:hypothetical protein
MANGIVSPPPGPMTMNESANGSSDNFTWHNPDFPLSASAPLNFRCFNDSDDQTCYPLTPGPLTVSAMALFGNESFFGTARSGTDEAAARSICQGQMIPFANQFPDYFEADSDPCFDTAVEPVEVVDPSDTVNLLLNWIRFLNYTDTAETALAAAVFYANQATLSLSLQASGDGVRDIYSSQGLTTQKPIVSLASIIVLSSLLFIEIFGLIALAVYILRTPTWTASFNSYTIAQLARSLNDDVLPPPGVDDEECNAALNKAHGIIGLVNDKEPQSGRWVQRLALGGLVPMHEAAPAVEVPKRRNIRRGQSKLPESSS